MKYLVGVIAVLVALYFAGWIIESDSQTEPEAADPPGIASSTATPFGLNGEQWIGAMEKYRGLPYRLGGTGEDGTMDCSGLGWRAGNDLGFTMPRTATHQRAAATDVIEEGLAKETPGAMVFFFNQNGVLKHVEYSTGKGQTYAAWVKNGVGPKPWGWWHNSWASVEFRKW